jgi:hypothetical protein
MTLIGNVITFFTRFGGMMACVCECGPRSERAQLQKRADENKDEVKGYWPLHGIHQLLR